MNCGFELFCIIFRGQFQKTYCVVYKIVIILIISYTFLYSSSLIMLQCSGYQAGDSLWTYITLRFIATSIVISYHVKSHPTGSRGWLHWCCCSVSATDTPHPTTRRHFGMSNNSRVKTPVNHQLFEKCLSVLKICRSIRSFFWLLINVLYTRSHTVWLMLESFYEVLYLKN